MEWVYARRLGGKANEWWFVDGVLRGSRTVERLRFAPGASTTSYFLLFTSISDLLFN